MLFLLLIIPCNHYPTLSIEIEQVCDNNNMIWYESVGGISIIIVYMIIDYTTLGYKISDMTILYPAQERADSTHADWRLIDCWGPISLSLGIPDVLPDIETRRGSLSGLGGSTAQENAWNRIDFSQGTALSLVG